MSKAGPYRQHLPALNLSIERMTESVPNDGRWYVLRDGETVGDFRSLKEAQVEWLRQLDASGWEPPVSKVDPKAQLERERRERWARNRAG